MKQFRTNSQNAKILKALKEGGYHCTSEFYADYMADPRRRMKDIQEAGYELLSRPCQKHQFHTGPSREWSLKDSLKPTITYQTATHILLKGKWVEKAAI